MIYLESISKIEGYTKDLPFEKFSKDRMVIDAVTRNFEIIGEASKNIPDGLKLLHNDVPWKEMAGMRDKVIHEYFGVDLEIVWRTIKGIRWSGLSRPFFSRNKMVCSSRPFFLFATFSFFVNNVNMWITHSNALEKSYAFAL